jgi:hypothetical protein
VPAHRLTAPDRQALDTIAAGDRVMPLDRRAVSRLAAMGLVKHGEAGWELTERGRREHEAPGGKERRGFLGLFTRAA